MKERVANELRTALEALRRERDELDEQIDLMEGTLSKLGVASSKKKSTKRKAGRKKAAGKRKATKRKASAPKKTRTKKKASKRRAAGKKAGSKKSGTKKKKPYWSAAARAAARERMKRYWAERRKSG